jgi:hypothetical protein
MLLRAAGQSSHGLAKRNYLRQNPGKLVELASLLGLKALNSTAIYTRPPREELAANLEQSGFNVGSLTKPFKIASRIGWRHALPKGGYCGGPDLLGLRL